jgi:hypothetical protein
MAVTGDTDLRKECFLSSEGDLHEDNNVEAEDEDDEDLSWKMNRNGKRRAFETKEVRVSSDEDDDLENLADPEIEIVTESEIARRKQIKMAIVGAEDVFADSEGKSLVEKMKARKRQQYSSQLSSKEELKSQSVNFCNRSPSAAVVRLL